MSAESPPARQSHWWSEPILHFLVIGLLLFVAHRMVAPVNQTGGRIVITQSLLKDLASQYQTRWMRPATEQEVAHLLDAYVRDEILYREGLALGLDRDDPVIKRRVRQKLDVLGEEQLASTVPTDADLSAYLSQHADRFTRPATLSFEQIFFGGTNGISDTDHAISTARAALARGVDMQNLGDSSLLPRRVDQLPVDHVRRDFGDAFTEQLGQLPVGKWSGPLASGFGTHLVRVTARTPSRLPPLEEVRQQVTRDWENERRDRSREQSYRQLRERYEVHIEPQKASAPAAKP